MERFSRSTPPGPEQHFFYCMNGIRGLVQEAADKLYKWKHWLTSAMTRSFLGRTWITVVNAIKGVHVSERIIIKQY